MFFSGDAVSGDGVWAAACFWFTQIDADNLRAAEVCSAEATELPVWKRPPVSVANGLCHPWDWIPARRPG